MDTKPFNLQAPEDIAKEYGGNKQRIAQAMQMGLVDPTAGTLAGMFIDRMRTAQMQEQAPPPQTIAQQVFAPPQPMMPPQGAPAPNPGPMAPAPMGGAPAPAPASAPPPLGMAAGGYVPPYMEGGLTELPLPDTMFDENRDGGYAGGGLVAFAQAGEVKSSMPDTFYGYSYKDPLANAAILDRLFGKPETKYIDAYERALLDRQTDAYRKREKRKDLGEFMANAGFGILAGRSPDALQNISGGFLPALAGAAERKRERAAEEREIQKGLIDIEQGRNTVAAQRAMRMLEAQKIGIEGAEAETGRRFTAEQKDKDLAFRRWETIYSQGQENARAAMRARGERDDKFNLSDDAVTIKGANGRDTVIPRMRVAVRGGSDYGYIYPQLGRDTILGPEHGSFAVGVTNAVKFAEDRGWGMALSPTNRLQMITRDGRRQTISDKNMRKFDSLGVNFNPSLYDDSLKLRTTK